MPDAPSFLPISWADHWEDVRLWRVLHRLDPGFYVDVGAMDPAIDSVTKVCYDLGWSGIDIEPNPHFAELLRAARPRDLIQEVACGAQHGRVFLHVVLLADGEQTGLTTLEDEIAERHVREGGSVRDVEVGVVPLSELMAGTPAEDPARFHFLKVDVEGFEAPVLQGADLRRFRPMVVVIEGRAPRSTEDTYAESEALLLGSDFLFAADDGLNRWYVRREDAALVDILRPETNPLLDGKPRRWFEVRREDELVSRMDELDEAARRSADQAEALRRENAALRAKLGVVHRGRSWLVALPGRVARRVRRAR
jgi:FkbM family methyltransferase